MNKILNSLLTCAIALSVSAVFAAEGNSAPDAQRKSEYGRGSSHSKQFDPIKFRERMVKRQAVLHDKLQLTSTQEDDWKTYVAAIAPPVETGKRPTAAEWVKLSAPERLEKTLERMKQHEARLATHLAAMKTFYAQLTPVQQKIFNENVDARHRRYDHEGK